MSINDWSVETVEACLEHIAIPSAAKLQTKDSRASGKYLVIDQGQMFIAGWTDDDAAVISAPLPLIVFGDHTRSFKFVDFPSVRGADGTQLLKARDGINALYFYYACRAIDLPSRGYNRHFTILKTKEILLAPSDDQQEIGRILRRVENGIDVQNQQLEASEDLKRAAMRELFTRGLRGEAQKETEIGPVPERWETLTGSEAVRAFRFERSKQIPRSAYSDWGLWPIIDQGQDFIAGFVSDEGKVIRSDSPLIIFGDHTRVFKFVDFNFALGADGTKPLLAVNGFDPKYLYHALCNLDVPARGYNRHYTVFSV